MVKLKRLKVLKYRNVRPGTELHFDDGVNLVLGQNGSGKTTLLALIAAVAANDLSSLEQEAFELEYELHDGEASLQVRAENFHDAFASSERVHDRHHGDAHLAWRYSVTLHDAASSTICEISGDADGTSLELRVTGTQAESWRIKTRAYSLFNLDFILDGLEHASVAAHVPDTSNDPADAFLALSSRATALLFHEVCRFDESLDNFLAMTGRRPRLTLAGTSPVSEYEVTEHTSGSRRRSFRKRKFTPPGLLAAIVQPVSNNVMRVAGERPAPPDDLSFLHQAVQILDFAHIDVKPEIKASQELGGSLRRVEGLGFSFMLTRRDETLVHHDLLSYGQKRLLAFFYYLAATQHFVIADELVNGLHHRWIEACMRAIGDRQSFLTSQNPLLFEYVDFDSVEQVQARFITCRTKRVDGAEQLVWENMPRDDATRFYEGYRAEIESIGDILINRGLW
jgi:energy-coupling factor transporter ATP-binding protein EcfA2